MPADVSLTARCSRRTCRARSAAGNSTAIPFWKWRTTLGGGRAHEEPPLRCRAACPSAMPAPEIGHVDQRRRELDALVELEHDRLVHRRDALVAAILGQAELVAVGEPGELGGELVALAARSPRSRARTPARCGARSSPRPGRYARNSTPPARRSHRARARRAPPRPERNRCSGRDIPACCAACSVRAGRPSRAHADACRCGRNGSALLLRQRQGRTGHASTRLDQIDGARSDLKHVWLRGAFRCRDRRSRRSSVSHPAAVVDDEAAAPLGRVERRRDDVERAARGPDDPHRHGGECAQRVIADPVRDGLGGQAAQRAGVRPATMPQGQDQELEIDRCTPSLVAPTNPQTMPRSRPPRCRGSCACRAGRARATGRRGARRASSRPIRPQIRVPASRKRASRWASSSSTNVSARMWRISPGSISPRSGAARSPRRASQ